MTLYESEKRPPPSPQSPLSRQSGQQDNTGGENGAAVFINTSVASGTRNTREPQEKQLCRRGGTTGVRGLQAMGLELLARRENYEYELRRDEIALARQRLALDERKVALEEERHRLDVHRRAEEHSRLLARLDRLEQLFQEKSTSGA
ncbi:uncharacterized protein LOC144130256 [Amblyomma americanum]